MIIRSVILISSLLRVAPLLGEQMDSSLSSLIQQEEISSKLKETAKQIQEDYKDKDLVIVMVMKGAICLAADLIRELDLPLDLEYVRCSSYGAGGIHRGELTVQGLDRLNLQDRDVLIVDDIFDTGHTLTTLLQALAAKNPRSIRSLVLLSKNVPHVSDYRPEYVLFDIEDRFVVGYGLDYKERYRGLPGIYIYRGE